MQLVLALVVTTAAASAAMSTQIASYDIKASLDTKTHIIHGSEVLTWVNDSPDTVTALRFHLYMNAFRNSQSTFMRESGGQLRSDSFKGDEWGWVDVSRLRRTGGADLTKAMRFVHPDDDNALDRTVMEVALDKPVKPGETIQVDIDFDTKLPKVFARTGFSNDFYLGGQWFPKIGVWEKVGFRHALQSGWNCHQFHANSEFFANFGRYRVELSVPSNMVVGATGEQKSRVDNKGVSTYTFEQEDVTDFAWTAQPTYLRQERMFIADKETTPQEVAAAAKLHGIPENEARLSDVKMIALVQPEHAEQMERHFHALRAAIKWFGLWYGHYPYKTITVVDPPANGNGAGGMEYPTFITAGTSYKLPSTAHLLEEVVVHEFGHQFWMELVATNEFEESWLDEGFNTYSTSKIMDKVYGGMGQLPVKLFGMNLWSLLRLPWINEVSMNRAQFLSAPAADDLVRKSWQYYDSNSYGINSYPRTGLTLNTLENILGSDRMARLMRAYHQKWRFHHPDSRDFQDVASQSSGENLEWFFSQFVFGNKLLDYRVGSVDSKQVRTPIGVFEKNGKQETVTRKMGDEQDSKNNDDKKFTKQYECIVKVRREGDAQVPVTIDIHFKDGKLERRQWDGQYRWVKYTFLRDSEIDWVQVDPERKYQLDVDYANNSWQKRYNVEVSTHWSGNLLFWLQNTLLWMTSLA